MLTPSLALARLRLAALVVNVAVVSRPESSFGGAATARQRRRRRQFFDR
jgi:hypothetical protein